MEYNIIIYKNDLEQYSLMKLLKYNGSMAHQNGRICINHYFLTSYYYHFSF